MLQVRKSTIVFPIDVITNQGKGTGNITQLTPSRFLGTKNQVSPCEDDNQQQSRKRIYLYPSLIYGFNIFHR